MHKFLLLAFRELWGYDIETAPNARVRKDQGQITKNLFSEMEGGFFMVRGSKNKCYYCGHEEICTADHFYPKSKGGRLKVYACGLCQRTKADLSPEQFVIYIKNHIAISDESKNRITRSVKSLISLINRGEL